MPDARGEVYTSALTLAGLWSILMLALSHQRCCSRTGMTQQAIWHMIREENPNIYHLAKLPFDELKERPLKIRGLEARDFKDAFEKIRSPITRTDIDRYEEWNRNFGE